MYIVVGSYFTPLFPLPLSERPVNHPHCYTYNPRFFLPRAIFFPYHSPRLVPYFSFLFLAIKILILFGYRFLFNSVTVDLHQCIYNILYLYMFFCCIEVSAWVPGNSPIGPSAGRGSRLEFFVLASTPTSVAFSLCHPPSQAPCLSFQLVLSARLGCCACI